MVSTPDVWPPRRGHDYLGSYRLSSAGFIKTWLVVF